MERNDPNVQSSGGADALARPRIATEPSQAERLLTPGDVARLFGVDPKTVSRWADAGKLQALRTLGGHRRYRAAEVHDLLSGTRADAN